MGDVMDSTLVHINDLPIPIHQRGLILMKHDYYYIFLKVKILFSLKSLSFKLLKSIFFGLFPLWSNCEITLRLG